MDKRQCENCGGVNIQYQTVNEVELKNKHHSIFWWITIGWLWVMFKWLFLTVPALILKLFGHKKQKIKNIIVTYAVCQDCGHRWKIS